MDTRRAEAFSDGVFAVAITVLVFNLLSLARSDHAVSYRELGQGWPQYAAYAVSFVTIGIMWLNHHTLLGHVDRVNRQCLVINIFLLMGVVAIPYPTALVADSLGPHSGGSRAPAAVAYGAIMVVISIGYATMWVYLAAHQDTLAVRPIRTPRLSTLRFTGGLVGYVTAIVVAIFVPDVALAMYAVLAIYYLFEHLPTPGGDPATVADMSADQPGAAGSAGPTDG